MEMSCLNYILTFIRLIFILSVVSGKKEIVSLEINIPSFVNSIFGIDPSLKKFRATVGSNKDHDFGNDLAIAVTTSNRTDSNSDRFHKRATADNNLLKMNIVGANDAAAALQEMVQPFAGMAPQYVIDALQSFARRSSPITKPRVEMAPGTYKSEMVTYPPNFFEKKLKFLVELQKKKDEKEQKEKQNG